MRYVIHIYSDYETGELAGAEDTIKDAVAVADEKRKRDYTGAASESVDIFDTDKLAIVCSISRLDRDWFYGYTYSDIKIPGIPTDDEWNGFCNGKERGKINVDEFVRSVKDKR